MVMGAWGPASCVGSFSCHHPAHFQELWGFIGNRFEKSYILEFEVPL